MAISSLKETLHRLAMSFAVRDVMVPTENLTCAMHEKDVRAVSSEHTDFEIIPIKRHKEVISYFDRASDQIKPVTFEDLISDGTSIVDLVRILAKRRFHFVLADARITGFVHFSDLYNHVVKLTLYAIIEALESHALALLGPSIDEEYLGQWLGKKRFKRIKHLFERTRAKEADLSWADFLNIEDILRLAVKAGKMQLDEYLIKAIKQVRDRVAHQINPLVKEHKDAIKLAQITRRCVELLGNA